MKLLLLDHFENILPLVHCPRVSKYFPGAMNFPAKGALLLTLYFIFTSANIILRIYVSAFLNADALVIKFIRLCWAVAKKSTSRVLPVGSTKEEGQDGTGR